MGTLSDAPQRARAAPNPSVDALFRATWSELGVSIRRKTDHPAQDRPWLD